MTVFFHKAAPNSPLKAQSSEELTLELRGQLVRTRVRVNRRAKRFILRVDPVERVLNITSPSKRGIPEALAFARSSAVWICDELNAVPAATPFADGVAFPFLGRTIKIANHDSARRRTLLDENTLLVGGDAAHVNRRVMDWLRKQARSHITTRVDQYTTQLEKAAGRISVRDTKSRWGSCSSDGTLSFSWRIILAPEAIFDYVVAHECAHLVHMNHSPSFWTVVASLNVDAKKASVWFHENGADLHRWGVLGADTAPHQV